MILNIDDEIAWMQHFRKASKLTAAQFDALLAAQRTLFAQLAPIMQKEASSGALNAPGYYTCHDCGAIFKDDDDCPICITVNRALLPRMAFGVLLEDESLKPLGSAIKKSDAELCCQRKKKVD